LAATRESLGVPRGAEGENPLSESVYPDDMKDAPDSLDCIVLRACIGWCVGDDASEYDGDAGETPDGARADEGRIPASTSEGGRTAALSSATRVVPINPASGET
jgi:hypothetical protein